MIVFALGLMIIFLLANGVVAIFTCIGNRILVKRKIGKKLIAQGRPKNG
ncbi:MAG: hypothetical protein K0Q56_914 [Sporolactobacillus laevolacticus]|jgi:hypothetical protein|nr:hypothetical protein [Sporolactobacillus laevolacticus]